MTKGDASHRNKQTTLLGLRVWIHLKLLTLILTGELFDEHKTLNPCVVLGSNWPSVSVCVRVISRKPWPVRVRVRVTQGLSLSNSPGVIETNGLSSSILLGLRSFRGKQRCSQIQYNTSILFLGCYPRICKPTNSNTTRNKIIYTMFSP